MGIFGISKHEAWKRLCDETSAAYIKGGLWKDGRVEMAFRKWNIVLDSYVVSTGKTVMVYTRMRALFERNDDFAFRIYKKSIFSGMAKALGLSAKHIETGNPAIDKAFVVKGNNEKKVLKLLSDKHLADLLLVQRQMDFYIKRHGSKKNHMAELTYQVSGVIKDVELLKKLFELFTETLTALYGMGVICRDKDYELSQNT